MDDNWKPTNILKIPIETFERMIGLPSGKAAIVSVMTSHHRNGETFVHILLNRIVMRPPVWEHGGAGLELKNPSA